MLRKGYTDVAVIEPSDKHYYQPLWTLVGGGQAKAASTERAESSVMPRGATWIRKAVSAFDPDNNTVTCTDGATYGYDVLVVAPGIQLDWDDYGASNPRWATVVCRRTTGSISHRRRGTSSATPVRAPRCSPCRPAG